MFQNKHPSCSFFCPSPFPTGANSSSVQHHGSRFCIGFGYYKASSQRLLDFDQERCGKIRCGSEEIPLLFKWSGLKQIILECSSTVELLVWDETWRMDSSEESGFVSKCFCFLYELSLRTGLKIPNMILCTLIMCLFVGTTLSFNEKTHKINGEQWAGQKHSDYSWSWVVNPEMSPTLGKNGKFLFQ